MESLPPKTSSNPTSPWQPNQESQDFMPPAKRQRLSPGPSSPYTPSPQTPYGSSPNLSNISLPNGAFNHQRPQNGGFSQFRGAPPFSTTPTPGLMGPPQRPAERQRDQPAERPVDREDKPLDINDINDLVASSGINIREEEDFLYASYRNDRSNPSFRSDSSQAISPQNSFDLLSRNNFGNLGASHGSFQQEQSQQSQEEELYDKHRKAARAQNEKRQQHLDDPFLWGASIRKFLEKSANDNSIRIPIDGLWDRVAEKPQAVSGTSAKAADGSGVQAAKAPSLLTRGAPMEPILALLSLAANERIRGLLEDAYGLARGRMFGSDGIVPPQWSDLAATDGANPTTAVPRSVSRSAWDDPNGPASPAVVSKRQNGLPSPPVSNASPTHPDMAVPTVEFPKTNGLTSAMISLSKRDQEAEEARLKLRATRRAKKAAQAAQAVTSTAVTPESGTPAPADGKLPPGMLGERAPEAPSTKKEKEKAKAANKDVSEEVATRNANMTASMQLGGRKYNWMSGGKAASGTATPTKKPAAQDGQDLRRGLANATSDANSGVSRDKNLSGKDGRKFGDWREDGVGGRGVQLRDWVAILEADGKERRTLARAYAILGDEKMDQDAAREGSTTI